MNSLSWRSKRQKVYTFLLFSVSPFIGIWVVLRNLSQKNVIFFFVLILACFGLLYNYNTTADGAVHYMRSLQYYSNMSLEDFFQESLNILSQNPTLHSNDLYIHFLSFITNSVLGIPKALHLFAGIVLGYIIGKTLQLVGVLGLKENVNRSNYLIFLVLIIVHSVYPLNAIRIGTGMWLLAYAIIAYSKTNKRKYLLYMFLATQIHFAYMVIMLPALVAIFLRRLKYLVVAIFVSSFIFQVTDFNFRSLLPQTEVAGRKSSYILDDDGLRNREKRTIETRENRNFYAAWGYTLYGKWGLTLLLFGYLPFYLLASNEKSTNYLFSSIYLFYSYANVFTIIPSLQGRIINVVLVLMLCTIVMLKISDLKPRLHPNFIRLCITLNYTFVGLSFFMLLTRVSHIIDTTYVYFLGFPLVSLLPDSGLSIKEFITFML